MKTEVTASTTKRFFNRELHNDAILIFVSSFSSAMTYILIDKVFHHWMHPFILLLIAFGFTAVFYAVIVLLRFKKNLMSSL